MIVRITLTHTKTFPSSSNSLSEIHNIASSLLPPPNPVTLKVKAPDALLSLGSLLLKRHVFHRNDLWRSITTRAGLPDGKPCLPASTHTHAYAHTHTHTGGGLEELEELEDFEDFSVSHHNGVVGIAVALNSPSSSLSSSLSSSSPSSSSKSSSHLVGFDIVDPSAVLDLSYFLSFFTPAEYAAFTDPSASPSANLRRFHLNWGIKEAWAKALGVGVAVEGGFGGVGFDFEDFGEGDGDGDGDGDGEGGVGGVRFVEGGDRDNDNDNDNDNNKRYRWRFRVFEIDGGNVGVLAVRSENSNSNSNSENENEDEILQVDITTVNMAEILPPPQQNQNHNQNQNQNQIIPFNHATKHYDTLSQASFSITLNTHYITLNQREVKVSGKHEEKKLPLPPPPFRLAHPLLPPPASPRAGPARGHRPEYWFRCCSVPELRVPCAYAGEPKVPAQEVGVEAEPSGERCGAWMRPWTCGDWVGGVWGDFRLTHSAFRRRQSERKSSSLQCRVQGNGGGHQI